MLTANKYIENTDRKINLINENGDRKLILDLSLNFGLSPSGETAQISEYYRKKGYGVEIRTCKRKLIDIILEW